MSQRDHIIHETTRMFIAEGLKSIRMDDIAQRLSVSKRTLYELFGDKENLIMECIMYNHMIEIDRISEVTKSAKNVLEEIMLMLQEWDRSIDSRHKLMLSLYKFYPALHKKILQKEQDEGLPLFRAKLEEGAKQGVILDNLDFELTIKLFTAAVHGIVSPANTAYPEVMPRPQMVRYMLLFFIRSISTIEGIKVIDKYL